MNFSPDVESKIIVLLAHYNDNERLKKALQSINETIPVDVLVVDDGSKIRPNQEELQDLYKGGNSFLSFWKKMLGLKKQETMD